MSDASFSDAEDIDGDINSQPGRIAPLNEATAVPRAVAPSSNVQGNRPPEAGFNEVWFTNTQAIYLMNVRQRGKEACLWREALKFWHSRIQNAPYERVKISVARKVLVAARLTGLNQPIYYETFRRLGPRILENEESNMDSLLETMRPLHSDSNWYRRFYGAEDRWDREFLSYHLEKLTGVSTSTEKHTEEKFGFSIVHVRSKRYHPVEMAAILRGLVGTTRDKMPGDLDANLTEEWLKRAEKLEDLQNDELNNVYTEVQMFVIRCMEHYYRAQQSLESAMRRAADVGVIPFCKLDSVDRYDFENTELDRFYHDHPGGQETATLAQIEEYVNEEKRVWDKWKSVLDFEGVPEPQIFKFLDDLSAPSMMTNLTSYIKVYMERKVNLRENARRAGRLACVREAILESQKQVQDAKTMHGEGRRIAVFGYKMAHNEKKGVPESEEKSVVVRMVSLYRKTDSNDSRQELDSRLFEIGLSLSGNYLNFDLSVEHDDTVDVLKTCGLGIETSDSISFYQFVNRDKHSPNSKTVEEILSQTNPSTPKFTHILLVLNDKRSEGGSHFQDISDAGSRFLIDLREVGNVKTEGVGYSALAVEPIASVCQVGESTEVLPFYRLAVLMPPSAVYQTGTGRLTATAPRGQGFMESAEVIAGIDILARSLLNQNILKFML